MIAIDTPGCSVGKGSDELASQSELEDMDKEPQPSSFGDMCKEYRNNYCTSFLGKRVGLSTLETFLTCMSFLGIPLGQPLY